jgi:uncharacterized protein YndB with AHSA1/START domain
MPSIIIKAPPDKVFEAMSDLTRHASWAKHDIVITGDEEGSPAVGNTYSSSKAGGKPDRLTITSLTPNESIDFHWESGPTNGSWTGRCLSRQTATEPKLSVPAE